MLLHMGPLAAPGTSQLVVRFQQDMLGNPAFAFSLLIDMASAMDGSQLDTFLAWGDYCAAFARFGRHSEPPY
jgi:hypothetical protein